MAFWATEHLEEWDQDQDQGRGQEWDIDPKSARRRLSSLPREDTQSPANSLPILDSLHNRFQAGTMINHTATVQQPIIPISAHHLLHGTTSLVRTAAFPSPIDVPPPTRFNLHTMEVTTKGWTDNRLSPLSTAMDVTLPIFHLLTNSNHLILPVPIVNWFAINSPTLPFRQHPDFITDSSVSPKAITRPTGSSPLVSIWTAVESAWTRQQA